MEINIHDSEGMSEEYKQKLQDTIREILRIISDKYGEEILDSLKYGASFLKLEPDEIPSLHTALETTLAVAKEDDSAVILSVGSVFCILTPETDIEQLKKELFKELTVAVDSDGRIMVRL